MTDFQQLAAQTNLDANELQLIYQQAGLNSLNRQAAFLTVLVEGSDALGQTIDVQSSNQNDKTLTIDQTIILQVYGLYNPKKNIGLVQILKKTPAYQNGFFGEDVSDSIGVTFGNNSKRITNNPVTGPEKTTPSLTEYALYKVNPKFLPEFEKYCNIIRTRSYLSLPSLASGSINQVMAKLNGILGAYQEIVMNIYRGAVQAIQQFYATINGIIVRIQQLLVSVVEQIIPLDLLELILETVQTVLDDVSVLTGLFLPNSQLNNYLSQFQQYLNIGTTITLNPFNVISEYLPDDVLQIIQTVNQFGSDPDGFLADQLANYGYSYILTALRGDILGAVIDKFGPQFAMLGPISSLLNNIESRTNIPGPFIPKTPAIIGPSVYHRSINGNDFYVNRFGDKINPPILNPKDYVINE